MFQFRRFPSCTYLIQCRIPFGGFPHSEISGSMLICSSPKLIAAYHVLHRLLMPRHSPCALFSLTYDWLSPISVNHIRKVHILVLYYSWIMQAHYRISVFLAKIVFLPLQMIFKMSICKTFSLLLPSHNCIIIHNVQFSRCIWVPFSRDSMKHFLSKVLQSISLKWWAKMDSNHRPHDYQSCALASWAIGPYQLTSFGGD